MNILHVDSSPLGQNSVSRVVSAKIVAELQAAHQGAKVSPRDLAVTTPNHLTGEMLFAAADQDLAPELKAELAFSDELIDEFLAADIIVVGAPMYNFSVPSQLKAWIDRIAKAGRTFRYTENGPEGLAKGKRVIVASSRGGIYSEGPAAAMDHQEAYLKAVFAFLGVSSVEIVRAEGIALAPDAREKAIAKAGADAQKLAVAA
ncbi:FMN-dependent NADH-azoreductase [Lacibacterium aquatile]|uniref:FMN dependent NADH:quinone oxidoreductase n=1 Tax=Lacibacterium aquatile TaxID=1168082 RepID=A0ABW5DMA0_9PROT